jgi:hypothetical protein
LDIYDSAHRHGIADVDSVHAVHHAVVSAEDEEDNCLYLGADRSGNMIEVVSVIREDGSEIVIHAMRMRRRYERLLRGEN